MTVRDRSLPRRLTIPRDASSETIARLVNEWQRDASESLRTALSGDYAGRLRPTPVQVRSTTAKPWQAVLCDMSRGAMDVTLPRASDVAATVIAVVNVSGSENALTIRCGWPADRINGEPTIEIAYAYGARWLYSTGEQWVTISATGSADPSRRALLWEWNGTDLTQFASASAVGATVDPTPADPNNPPYTIGTLSVVANATVPGGNVLRATMEIPSGMSSLAQGVLFLTAEDLGVDRFVIELTQVSISTTNRYVGVGWYGSVVLPAAVPPSYAYCRMWGTAGNLMRVDTHEPTITATTTTPNLLTETAGVVRIVVDGDRDGSGLPRFRTHDFGWRDTGADGAGSTTGGSTSHGDWPSEPAPAGWATTPQSRIGLAMRVAGGLGTGVTHTWDIRALRVYRHPKDL